MNTYIVTDGYGFKVEQLFVIKQKYCPKVETENGKLMDKYVQVRANSDDLCAKAIYVFDENKQKYELYKVYETIHDCDDAFIDLIQSDGEIQELRGVEVFKSLFDAVQFVQATTDEDDDVKAMLSELANAVKGTRFE